MFKRNRASAMRVRPTWLKGVSSLAVVMAIVLAGPLRASAETVPSPIPEKPAGLLPLPVGYDTGPLAHRPYLSGDWNGTRTDLAECGVTFDLAWTQTFMGVVEGGNKTGWRYGGKLDSRVNFDLDRMGVMQGALLSIRAESRYGESINDLAGTLLPVNEVQFFPLTSEPDEDVLMLITELRYTQFLSEHLGVFAGKFVVAGGDLNEFAGGLGDTQFLSHTFMNPPVTSLVNPYSTVGGGVFVMPNPYLTISSSLYASTDSSNSTGLNTLDDGLVWSTGVRGQYRLGQLPGGMGVTFQYAFDNDFVDFEGQFVSDGSITFPYQGDSWNLFWNGWQYLYAEETTDRPINLSDGRADLQGVGLFARAGVADEDTNPIEWFVSVGLGGRGLIPGRDEDTFGAGYVYSRGSTDPVVTSRVLNPSANRYEFYYNAALTPSTNLTLDLQFADALEAGQDPATVLGCRLRVAF